MSLVELKSVTKTYRLGTTDVAALNGVDLDLGAGEFVALWGPSGSGKTSLLNIIGLIDFPTSGTVTLDGLDAAGLSENGRAELRNNRIGFIFQNFNLVSVLSALENVMLPLRIKGVSDREAREKALARLAEVEISGLAANRPDKMSGGQRQRVAIARALVTGPALVIADEPTANLDSGTSHRIIELMRSLNRSKGTTFLFATHDQRLLDKAERLIKIEDGLITGAG